MNEITDVCNKLYSLELDANKTQVIIAELLQSYFSESVPPMPKIQCEYNQLCTFVQIAMDYSTEVHHSISEIINLMDKITDAHKDQ